MSREQLAQHLVDAHEFHPVVLLPAGPTKSHLEAAHSNHHFQSHYVTVPNLDHDHEGSQQ
jgi:hypothetical protein